MTGHLSCPVVDGTTASGAQQTGHHALPGGEGLPQRALRLPRTTLRGSEPAQSRPCAFLDDPHALLACDLARARHGDPMYPSRPVPPTRDWRSRVEARPAICPARSRHRNTASAPGQPGQVRRVGLVGPVPDRDRLSRGRGEHDDLRHPPGDLPAAPPARPSRAGLPRRGWLHRAPLPRTPPEPLGPSTARRRHRARLDVRRRVLPIQPGARREASDFQAFSDRRPGGHERDRPAHDIQRDALASITSPCAFRSIWITGPDSSRTLAKTRGGIVRRLAEADRKQCLATAGGSPGPISARRTRRSMEGSSMELPAFFRDAEVPRGGHE